MPFLSYIISAAIAFGAAWQIQQWRADAHETDRLTQQIESERRLHDLEQARSQQVQTATNNARKREAVLKADAVAASNAADSLRAQSASAVLSAHASLDACTSAVDTYDKLLVSCSGEYQKLGEVADAHASDVKTLAEAWPK